MEITGDSLSGDPASETPWRKDTMQPGDRLASEVLGFSDLGMAE